jgi:hypothetical protein
VIQQLADLAERGPRAQHLGGQTMTKLMCSISGGFNTGAREATPNNQSNGTAAKAPDGSFGAQKYSPSITLRSSSPQIRDNRLADLGG